MSNAPTAGPVPVGKDFRRVLARVHQSSPHPRTKAFTEMVENAVSAQATYLNIYLTSAANIGAAVQGNAKMLVIETDTYISDLSATVFQFAHSTKEGKGLLNQMGIGSKVFHCTLGQEVQMLVLTTDGEGRVACGRSGSVIDKLQNPKDPNSIGRCVAFGNLKEDGQVAFDWHDDFFAQHVFCTHSQWHHERYSLDVAAERMCSLLKSNPRSKRTFFVLHPNMFLQDDLPLQEVTRDERQRLQVIEADGQVIDLVDVLQTYYMPNGSIPTIRVNHIEVTRDEHPWAKLGSVSPRETTTYDPVFVPGMTEPLMFVSCASLASAEAHLSEFEAQRSGAYFTFGDCKILNPDRPNDLFVGGVFAISDRQLSLTTFKQSGEIRPSQYAAIRSYVCCDDHRVENKFDRTCPIATFKKWKPRQSQMWNRLGLGVLCHVIFNSDTVTLNQEKTQVILPDGVSASASLAHLRYHIFQWSVTRVEETQFVPPFSAAYEVAVVESTVTRQRSMAIVPFIHEAGPVAIVPIVPIVQKVSHRRAPRMMYAARYASLLREMRNALDTGGTTRQTLQCIETLCSQHESEKEGRKVLKRPRP